MDHEHVEKVDPRPAPARAPRRLHKPHREVSDLELEQVVTYASDGDGCTDPTVEISSDLPG
jgi:hypothetical protein